MISGVDLLKYTITLSINPIGDKTILYALRSIGISLSILKE